LAVKEFLGGKVNVANNPTMIVVAAALVNGEGRVLLQQRAANRQMGGLWEFPGGKIEDGEVPEAALVRELEEELGIGVEAASLAPAAFASAPLGARHLLLLLYICREWDGTPQPLDASALKWVRTDEMPKLSMPPADEPLVALLEALL
jgi:8-oxo-dGTP diphosphatase